MLCAAVQAVNVYEYILLLYDILGVSSIVEIDRPGTVAIGAGVVGGGWYDILCLMTYVPDLEINAGIYKRQCRSRAVRQWHLERGEFSTLDHIQ